MLIYIIRRLPILKLWSTRRWSLREDFSVNANKQEMWMLLIILDYVWDFNTESLMVKTEMDAPESQLMIDCFSNHYGHYM